MPAQNIQDVLGTFVDGNIVSANDATFGLNPKMEQLRSVVNDHATLIDGISAQVSGLGGLFYNVVTYGADPTGVADSTAGIQAAVTAAVAQNGIVIFSNGTYQISSTITISGSCSIISDGTGQGVTIFQTSAVPIFTVAGNYVSISDLKFDVRGAIGTSDGVISSKDGVSRTGIKINNCYFYSSYTSTSPVPPSFVGVYVTNVTGLSIVECTAIGNNTSSSNSYNATLCYTSNCSTTLISRNTCTYTTNPITVYASSLRRGAIIEQNTITSYKGDAISSSSISGLFIEKNSISVSVSTTGTQYSTLLSLCLNSTFVDNIVDNTSSSATSGAHIGIGVVLCSYINITRNSFSLGKNVVYASASSYINLTNNTFYQPESYAIYFTSVTDANLIAGNSFNDVWSASGVTSCIIDVSGSGTSRSLIIDDNCMRRGSKTATYVNSYGVTIPSGGTSPMCLMSANDFSLSAISAYNAIALSIYSVEPNGARIMSGTTYPVTGTWKVGDKVALTAPVAGGYTGYVCTTAGTSGTWKGYGLIQA
jgi:hypothetical protein